MSTNFRPGMAVSPNSGSTDRSPSATEKAAWALFAPYLASRKAVWLEAGALLSQPPSGALTTHRFARACGPSDPPAQAMLADRAGSGRRFVVDPVMGRHPVVVTDDLTGRPVMAFGAGGVAPNLLAQTANGAMRPLSERDSLGVQLSDVAMLTPGTGWSVAAKVRVPSGAGTVNGIPFPSTNRGGAIFGGRAETTQDDAFSLYIRADNGRLQAGNRGNVGLVNDTVDHRDGIWHDIIATYDVPTGVGNLWIDSSAVVSAASLTDVSTVSGADKILFGGVGNGAGIAPANRFTGFIACAFYLPAPVLNVSGNRTIMRNLMATK